MKKLILLFMTALFIISIASATVLSECQTGLTSDAYTLSANVTANGTSTYCFEITGSDVEIDCNGFWIIGNQTTGTDTTDGIEIDLAGAGSNFTVKDCTFSNINTRMIYINSGKTVGLTDIKVFNNTMADCGDASCNGLLYGNDFNVTNVNATSNFGSETDTSVSGGTFIYFVDSDGYYYGTNTISYNSITHDVAYITDIEAGGAGTVGTWNIFNNNINTSTVISGLIQAGRADTDDLGTYNIYDNTGTASSMSNCLVFLQNSAGSHWNSYRNFCNQTNVAAGIKSQECLKGIEEDYRSTNDTCIGFKGIDTTAAVGNVSIINLSWDNDIDGIPQYHTIEIPAGDTCDLEIDSMIQWDKIDFDGMWSPVTNPWKVKLQGCATGSEEVTWNISYADQTIPADYYNASGTWWISDTETQQDFYQAWKQQGVTTDARIDSSFIAVADTMFAGTFSGTETSYIYYAPYVQSTTPTIDVISPRINKTFPSGNDVEYRINTINDSSACLIATDDGSANQTMAGSLSTYWTYTNSTMPDATYVATFYCNDTAGSWHTTTREFVVGDSEDVYSCVFDMEENITYNLKADLPAEMWSAGPNGLYCMYNEFPILSDNGFNMTIDGEGHSITVEAAGTNVNIEGNDAHYAHVYNLTCLHDDLTSGNCVYLTGVTADVSVHDIKTDHSANNVFAVRLAGTGLSEVYNIIPYNSTSGTGKIRWTGNSANGTFRDSILKFKATGGSQTAMQFDSNDGAGAEFQVYNISIDSTEWVDTTSVAWLFDIDDTEIDIDDITFSGYHTFLNSGDAGGTIDNVIFNTSRPGTKTTEDSMTSWSNAEDGPWGVALANMDTHNLTWIFTNITTYAYVLGDKYMNWDATFNTPLQSRTDCDFVYFGVANATGNLTFIQSQAGGDNTYLIYDNASFVMGLNGANETRCEGNMNISYIESDLRNAANPVLFLDNTNTTQNFMSVDTTTKLFELLWNETQPISQDGAAVIGKFRPLGNGRILSCTYISGNWWINASDYCNITSNVAMGTNDIIINNSGTITITANITNWTTVRIDTAQVVCKSGGCFKW